MIEVIALTGFEHGSRRRRDERFFVSEQVATRLKAKRLVAVVEDAARPSKPAGAPSSASQAGQASPQTTSKRSAAGAKPRQKKANAA